MGHRLMLPSQPLGLVRSGSDDCRRIIRRAIDIEPWQPKLVAHVGSDSIEVAPQPRLTRTLGSYGMFGCTVTDKNGPTTRLTQDGSALNPLGLDQFLNSLTVDDRDRPWDPRHDLSLIRETGPAGLLSNQTRSSSLQKQNPPVLSNRRMGRHRRVGPVVTC